MKTYSVRIVETLSKIVEVVADSEIDALNFVEEMYCDSEVILDAEDFDFVDYIINKE